MRNISHGTERYGIIASSGAKRLRADGVTVPKDIDIEKWFLNGKDDVNSSYFMEVAASEFKIQGWKLTTQLLYGKRTTGTWMVNSHTIILLDLLGQRLIIQLLRIIRKILIEFCLLVHGKVI